MYNCEFISCNYISVFIPAGTETGIFQENKVKIMAADAMAIFCQDMISHDIDHAE